MVIRLHIWIEPKKVTIRPERTFAERHLFVCLHGLNAVLVLPKGDALSAEGKR